MSGALQLPDRARFDAIIQPILGNGDGSGVRGVASLLEGIDVGSRVGNLTGKLDSSLLRALPSAGASAGVGDLVSRIDAAMNALPVDPTVLLAPLTDRLGGIQTGLTSDLRGVLEEGLAGLGDVGALVPSDTNALLDAINPGIDAVKSSLISGPFGQLREWSERIVPLAAEISALSDVGAESLQERLIQWVTDKVAGVVAALMPSGDHAATALIRSLDEFSDTDPAALVRANISAFESSLAEVRSRLMSGDFTATGVFTQAEDRLAALVKQIEDAASQMESALDRAGDIEALTSSISGQIEDVRTLDVVDLGSIQDSFSEAIAGVQKVVEGIDLDAVVSTVRDPLEQVAAKVQDLGLDGLQERLQQVGDGIEELAGGLESGVFEVVATVRTALASVRDALRSVGESVGTFESDGTFQFDIANDIQSFLESARDAIGEDVLPLLTDFRGEIGSSLGQVRAALESVRGQIETVREELTAALAGAADAIEELDVEARVQEIAERLRGMLDDLGTVDFDVVVDPVVGELGEMGDSLREIDTASLNDILRESLKLAVAAVIEVDFAEDIGTVLLGQMDAILEKPRAALADVAAALEESLSSLAELAPGELLAPLEDVFDPVVEALGQLELESLAGPLTEWHQAALAQMEQVSPAALLEPLTSLHGDMVNAVAGVEPEALVAPVQQVIDDLGAEIRAIDLASLTGEVGGQIAQARAAVDRFSPEQLLAPASSAYGKILSALDGFDPAILLAPFADLFGRIESALDGLTEQHVDLLARAFEPLAALPARLNPEPVFATLQASVGRANSVVRDIDAGAVVAALQGQYRNVLSEVDVSAAPASVSDRLNALNPIRHEDLGRAVTRLSAQAGRMDALLESDGPPPALLESYAEISDRVQKLVPVWVSSEMTPDSVRRSIRLANPLAVEEEVRALWDAVKEKLAEVDPSLLAEPIGAIHTEVLEALGALDPDAVLGIGQQVVTRVAERIESIDLAFVATELGGAATDVRAVAEALDPAPVIAQLEAIAAEAKAAVTALDPLQLLEELQAPLDEVVAIVGEFDPAALREPLEAVFERVQGVIESVDLDVLLAPLVEKLEELRAALEAGLGRTETAFDGMLAAVPL